ncbi:hypothetical protein WA588_000440, partial [Blastocystis sp. NMH]
MKNKDELSRKKEKLGKQQMIVTELKRELERCELDVCRIEYHNMEIVKRRKEAAYREQTLDDNLRSIKNEMQSQQGCIRRLEKKMEQYQRIRKEEETKRGAFLERSIRRDVDQNRSPLESQKEQIRCLETEMESLRQLQNALQNERLAMKMRENKFQGEYAELTLTWKQKQSEACIIVSNMTTQVAKLNARLLQLNQEYTLLRQRQMQQQLEANYQKEEKRVERDSRQLMYRSR